MQTDTTSAASAIFAANRARGAVTFDVHQVDGVTRRRHLHESGSLRVRFPSPEADGLSAVFVNTAGGIAGGDRFDIDIAAGEGCASGGDDGGGGKNLPRPGTGRAAQYRLEGRGGRASRPGCRRRPFCSTAARVSRRIDIDLAESASLLLCEIVVFGRAAMGERMLQGEFVDRWRLRRGGRLVFAETIRLDGDIGEKLPAGDRQRRRRDRHRADRAGRRGAGGADPRAFEQRSAARSASPAGMDLQWRASVPKMRRGFAPI